MPKSITFLTPFVLWAVAELLAQAVTGTMLGTITDSSGARVANAKVVITETNTGIGRSVEANADGNYTFNNLTPGTYTVTVEQTGFRKAIRERVDVLVNTSVRVDVTLEVGNITEQVVVTADAPMLQTDRTDTGRKIETKTIVDLPLPMNRNFQGLLNLAPGTTRSFRPHSQFFNSQDSLATQVNGQSRLANNVQFEGVDNNHRTGLLSVLIPPIEALQTVDITTSNYEAELGRAGGAVTNIVLKSGTNGFHGSAYWYNRVSALGSRNPFVNRKPRSTYNYYGFTIGGPIIRNRTFFFADYLGIKDRFGYGQNLTIPSLEYRRGDFSGAPTIIYDPAMGDDQGRGRTPFPNNIIPDNRISPIARRILAQIPDPTIPGNGANFQTAPVQSKDTHSWDAKVDHQFGDKDRISVRYSFQQPEIVVPPVLGMIGGPSGTANDGFAGVGTNTTRSAAVNYTHVFTPTLITELRVGVGRYRNDARNSDYGTTAAQDIGIPNANISDFSSGMTRIDISGYSNPVAGYSSSLPWIRAETNWNLVNNWTKIINNHTLKFGFDARLNRDILFQTQVYGTRGEYRFRPGATARVEGGTTSAANAFAAFLLDAPLEYGRDIIQVYREYIQNPFFSYVQDKWQVSQKLTLDLGVRHELYPPARPRVAGGFSNYDASNNTLVVAGVGTNPMNLGRKTYWTFFAPRIGLSYRINEKTVARAGYGISYMPFPDNTYAFNFPVRQNNARIAPSDFLIAGSMAAGLPPSQPFQTPADGIIRNPVSTEAFDAIPLDFKEGYVQSYNAAVQRSLPANFVLEAAYVGNRGVRIPTVWNLNAGMIPGAGVNGRPLYVQFGRVANTDMRFFGTNTYYNSLQVKFDRRFSSGFQLTTAYTYSKSIDYDSGNGKVWFHIQPERNRARSEFDRTHTFVQSYIYDLPFGRGKAYLNSGPAAWVLGGWQVNGVLSVMSGLPLQFENQSSQLNAPDTRHMPNINGPFRVLGNIGSAGLWFDTSVFSAPPNGVIGNVGRNILNGPGFFNLDFSIFRRFPIKETIAAELRGEAYNLTNTPQYARPNTTLGNPNFGRITGLQGDSVGNPRAVQLGMRITF